MTEGLLQEIALSEIIQLVAMSYKTGDLELTPLFPLNYRDRPIKTGHIYFREGGMHAAFLAERRGEPAVENLFLWEAGSFAFRSLPANNLPPANLFTSYEILMLKGIARLDGWKSARELVPTLRVCPRRAASSRPPPEIHTAEAQMLARCDGQTQLSTIAMRLKLGGLRCRETAAALARVGHIVVESLSAGERLARAIVVAAMPTLGVAADMFCDDALKAVRLNPETLARTTLVTVPTVARIIGEIERSVAMVLGQQRARDLATTLSAALGVPAR